MTSARGDRGDLRDPFRIAIRVDSESPSSDFRRDDAETATFEEEAAEDDEDEDDEETVELALFSFRIKLLEPVERPVSSIDPTVG